jgi:predicted O-methyltransferase YrrM
MTGYSQLPRIHETALPEIRPHIHALYFLARQTKAKLICELGVRSGESTRALLAAAMDLDARLISIDIAGDAYHVRQVTEDRGISLDWGRWECRQCDSAVAALAFGPLSVDFVFFDTDHSLETTRREIAAWNDRLKPTGIMAFHDTALQEPNRDGVLPSMTEFVMSFPGWEMEVWNNVAPGDTGFGYIRRKQK